MAPAEIQQDAQMQRDLGPVEALLIPLLADISDTRMLAGSEAFTGAMPYYDAVRYAAGRGEAGAREIYDTLRVRFPGGRRKKQPLPPQG